jgi:hypothetical protein
MKKILSLTLALTAAAVGVQAQAAKPNILVIFGDDIGITDISAHAFTVDKAVEALRRSSGEGGQWESVRELQET